MLHMGQRACTSLPSAQIQISGFTSELFKGSLMVSSPFLIPSELNPYPETRAKSCLMKTSKRCCQNQETPLSPEIIFLPTLVVQTYKPKHSVPRLTIFIVVLRPISPPPFPQFPCLREACQSSQGPLCPGQKFPPRDVSFPPLSEDFSQVLALH